MPKFTILFFFCAFLSNAQVLNNNIVILSENGDKFTLYIDGEKINTEPQANVKAFNISEGWCKLRVEFATSGPFGEKDKIIVSDSIRLKPFEKNNNKEITYYIKQNNKSGKFVFVSIGELSGPPKPNVPEKPVEIGPIIDNNLYGNLYRAKENKPIFFDNYNDTTQTCRFVLDSINLKYGLNLVNKSNDIQNKYKYTEAIVVNNCYQVVQLIPLLNLLAVEMDKLKLVKKAYPHILDKANSKKLGEVFSFKSMKEDFEYFLVETANIEHQINLNCKIAVSDAKLSEIISIVKKEDYEHDKARVAKQQTVNNCLSTLQLRKMLEVFHHDRERMDLVKAAYYIIVDKENYKTLEDVFQFSENKKDFLKFISN